MGQLIDNKTGKSTFIEPSFRLSVDKNSSTKSGNKWFYPNNMDRITKAPSYKMEVVKQNVNED